MSQNNLPHNSSQSLPSPSTKPTHRQEDKTWSSPSIAPLALIETKGKLFSRFQITEGKNNINKISEYQKLNTEEKEISLVKSKRINLESGMWKKVTRRKMVNMWISHTSSPFQGHIKTPGGSPTVSKSGSPRLNLTPSYKTPPAGSKTLTPVYRVTQSAGRNLRSGERSKTSQSRTPVYRMVRKIDHTARLLSPDHANEVFYSPGATNRHDHSKVKNVTPVSRLLRSIHNRRAVQSLRSPEACDSVFSPRTPVISSPCNCQFLISQEKRLRHAWRMSVSESIKSCSIVEDKSTPQRTQDAITVQKYVGSGGFGSVYIGTYKAQNVAIKYMRKQVKNCVAHFENFLAELRAMSLCHKNVLKTLAASDPQVYESEAFLVMEYIDGRNLQQVIDDRDATLTLDKRVKFGSEIAAALEYCHNNNLVHLDIKPANVLVSSNEECKIADFGCCQFIESDQKANFASITGTYAYKAPELLRGNRPTIKADIYALGVTLWQMQSREMPYIQEDQHVIIFGVVAYNMRPRSLTQDPCLYSDLYRKCWDSSMDVRPEATYVKQQLRLILNASKA